MSVIGNLLDNAVDATLKAPVPRRWNSTFLTVTRSC
jgi:sensor histidine kinase regulating citrate/malate metabolism